MEGFWVVYSDLKKSTLRVPIEPDRSLQTMTINMQIFASRYARYARSCLVMNNGRNGHPPVSSD